MSRLRYSVLSWAALALMAAGLLLIGAGAGG